MNHISKDTVFKTIEDEYAKHLNVSVSYSEEYKDTIAIFAPFRGKNILIMVSNEKEGFAISTLVESPISKDDDVSSIVLMINEINSKLKRGHFSFRKNLGLSFDNFIHCSENNTIYVTDLFVELKLGLAMFELYIDDFFTALDEQSKTNEYVIQE